MGWKIGARHQPPVQVADALGKREADGRRRRHLPLDQRAARHGHPAAVERRHHRRVAARAHGRAVLGAGRHAHVHAAGDRRAARAAARAGRCGGAAALVGDGDPLGGRGAERAAAPQGAVPRGASRERRAACPPPCARRHAQPPPTHCVPRVPLAARSCRAGSQRRSCPPSTRPRRRRQRRRTGSPTATAGPPSHANASWTLSSSWPVRRHPDRHPDRHTATPRHPQPPPHRTAASTPLHRTVLPRARKPNEPHTLERAPRPNPTADLWTRGISHK
eukprot:2148572-Prymnesium_polylepis.1